MPHGHYKTTTITAALRASRPFAISLMDGATNGTRFLAYVSKVLAPVLIPEHIRCDNGPEMMAKALRKLVAKTGPKI